MAQSRSSVERAAVLLAAFVLRTTRRPRSLIVKRHGGSVPKITLSLISPVQKSAGFEEEIQFEVLRRLHQAPDVSQRTLARELGISLGSINFRFQALVEKGWIKTQNFSQSKNKLVYTDLLTPAGVAEKSKLVEFLKRRVAKYETLQAKIHALRSERAIDMRSEEECRSS